MEKKLIQIIMLIFSIAIFLGCSESVLVKYKIYSGTKKYKNRHFDSSLLVFIDASNITEQKNLKQYHEYAELGIASIYLIKNEMVYAEKKLKDLESSANKDILASVFYQEGIIKFQAGKYEQAKECFKNSMKYDSVSVDAKINFEICSQIIESSGKSNEPDLQKVNIENEEHSKAEKIIFDLIRQKEEHKWEKNSAKEEKPAPNDY